MPTTNVNLTMQQRLNVLKDLEMLSIATVAAKYGVCSMTVRRIRENASKILEFENKDRRQKKRQRLRGPVYSEMDQCLYSWFVERKTLGERVTDALLLKKASELKGDMPSCAAFKVSYGWLSKFKKRHGIQLVRVYSEEAKADENAAKTFTDNFQTFIEKNELNIETIYNMDESGLLWKALPTKTLSGENEKVTGHKQTRDRITIGLCANAAGTHKLMPLIINKQKQLKELGNAPSSLPVIFKSQKKSWMGQDLFVDWYINYFKPSVRQFQKGRGIFGKTILLLGNYPGYKMPPDYLEDDNFEMMYLPPNTTSLIQPMDQGISEITKRNFRCRMMRLVLQYHDGIQSFYSNYTVHNCLELVAEAWNMVTCSDIRNAWEKIISIAMPEIKEEKQEQLDIQEMQGMMSIIFEENAEVDDIEKFLHNCHQNERRRFTNMLAEKRRHIGDGEHMDIEKNIKVDESRDEQMKQNRDEEVEENRDEEMKQNRDEEIKQNRNEEMKQNRNEEMKQNRNEEMKQNRDEEMKQNRDEELNQNREDTENTENTDEDTKQNLNYQQTLEDCGIELNAQERRRLILLFKELEEFVPRMPLSTELHLHALKLSVLGSKHHVAACTDVSDLQNLWSEIGDHVDDISNYMKQFQESIVPEKIGDLIKAKSQLEKYTKSAPSLEDRQIARTLASIFERTKRYDNLDTTFPAL